MNTPSLALSPRRHLTFYLAWPPYPGLMTCCPQSLHPTQRHPYSHYVTISYKTLSRLTRGHTLNKQAPSHITSKIRPRCVLSSTVPYFGHDYYFDLSIVPLVLGIFAKVHVNVPSFLHRRLHRLLSMTGVALLPPSVSIPAYLPPLILSPNLGSQGHLSYHYPTGLFIKHTAVADAHALIASR